MDPIDRLRVALTASVDPSQVTRVTLLIHKQEGITPIARCDRCLTEAELSCTYEDEFVRQIRMFEQDHAGCRPLGTPETRH